MAKEMRYYPVQFGIDGNKVQGDFVITDTYSQVLVAGYFDRAKAKVKSIACSFGRKSISYGWNKFSTRDKEYRSCYKPVSVGRDRFIYTLTMDKSIGDTTILTTEKWFREDLYNTLMKRTKLPIIEDWLDYIIEKSRNDRALYDITSYRGVRTVDSTRTIPLHGEMVLLSDIKVYDVNGLNNEYLTKIISEGLAGGKIKICKEEMEPLKFETFDEYISKYGPSMVNNLEKEIDTLSPLNGRVNSVAFKSKRLFPQQAACINGIMALRKAGSRYGLMIEGMGCGKTLQGAGVVDAYFNKEWLDAHPEKGLKELYDANEVKYRNIMMAPSHLVQKWREEILSEVPGSSVTVIDDFSKLVELRDKGKERKGREWYLISKDKCKLGSTYSPIPTQVGRMYPKYSYCKDCLTEKGAWVLKKGVGNNSRCPDCGGRKFVSSPDESYGKVYGLICPDCGELLLKPSAKLGTDKIESIEELVLLPEDFSSRNQTNNICYNCGAQLWGVDCKPANTPNSEWEAHVQNHKPSWYKISHFKNYAKKSTKTAFVLRNHEGGYLRANHLEKLGKDLKNDDCDYVVSPREYGARKTAPSLFIKKYLKGYFDFCILDECHKYENGGTAQSNAAHALMHVSKFTLGLTGTICNGKADSFFYLLYMLDPSRMKKMGYSYSDVTEFARKYGTVETVYEANEGSGNYNSSSRGKQIQSPKVKPGISPLLFVDLLLDKSVFLDLSDLSKYIPKLTESVELVELPEEVQNSYTNCVEILKEALHSREGAGMLSNILQFGLSYPDKPYGRKPMVSPYVKDVVVLNVPNHDEYGMGKLLPKEEKLIEIVNSELSEGRNCFVYCTYTGEAETNVTARLQGIIEEHCNLKGRVQILQSQSPKPEEREQWIKAKAAEGIKVFICNPKCVETGLDFCFNYDGKFYNYPTLIFYQMSYELAVIWQASRRHYRLNQKEDCRTYYLAYENTLQAAAVQIMAEKQVAASAIQGKFSAEGLTAMARGVDPRIKLAQMLSDSDNSDRQTLSNMFDALNQSADTDEDKYGDDTSPVLTYYEVMGLVPGEDIVVETDTSLFDTFEDAEFKVVEEPKEEKKTENTDSESVSVFDFFDSSDFSVLDLTTGEVVTPVGITPKKSKKSIEGQISIFDFLCA